MTFRFGGRARRSGNKFNAQKTTVDGIVFASRAEAARYGELRLLEKAGVIQNLQCQPKWKFTYEGRPVLIRSKGFPNGRQASFRADFRYWCNERKAIVVEDVKGGTATRTEAYALRRALLEAMYPGMIFVEISCKRT